MLTEQLHRLARLEPSRFPVISLYLNARADEHGRDRFWPFVQRALHSRAKTFAPRSQERQSFENDIERIKRYLRTKVAPSANSVAIFASSGEAGLFEAIQLTASVNRNQIYVEGQPNLFTLAWLQDRHRRYAAVIADSNRARIFVFTLGELAEVTGVRSDKLHRTQVGGWSQARYQRHVDKLRLDHAKEVAHELAKTVEQENIVYIFLIGDDKVIPIIREELPQCMLNKVVDVLRIDVAASERQVLEKTLESMQARDAEEDAQIVEQLVGEYRAGGLAVVGMGDTIAALAKGQVDRLLLSASIDSIIENETLDEEVRDLAAGTLSPGGAGDPSGETRQERLAGLLVKKAEETGVRVTFVEQTDLMTGIGGVGAFLRYRA